MKSFNIPNETTNNDRNSNNNSKIRKNTSSSFSPLIPSINVTPNQVTNTQLLNLNNKDDLLPSSSPQSLS